MQRHSYSEYDSKRQEENNMYMSTFYSKEFEKYEKSQHLKERLDQHLQVALTRKRQEGTNSPRHEYHDANVRHSARKRLADQILQQESSYDYGGKTHDKRNGIHTNKSKNYRDNKNTNDNHIDHWNMEPRSSVDTFDSEDGFGIRKFQRQQQRQHTPNNNGYSNQNLRHSTSDIPHSRTKTPDSYYLQRRSLTVPERKKLPTSADKTTKKRVLNYRSRQKPMTKAQYNLIYGQLDDVRAGKSAYWRTSLRN